MKLPEIPTDNLYKFMAIAGLSILAVSWSYPPAKLMEIELMLVDAEAQIERIQIEKSAATRELERLEKKHEATDAEVAAFRLVTKEIALHVVDANKAVKVARTHSYFLFYYFALCLLGTYGGYVLASNGFRKWYRLTQVPTDEALHKATSKSEALVAPKRQSLRRRLSSRFPS